MYLYLHTLFIIGFLVQNHDDRHNSVYIVNNEQLIVTGNDKCVQTVPMYNDGMICILIPHII